MDIRTPWEDKGWDAEEDAAPAKYDAAVQHRRRQKGLRPGRIVRQIRGRTDGSYTARSSSVNLVALFQFD